MDEQSDGAPSPAAARSDSPIALAWQRWSTPQQEPRHGLSVGRIVQAAIDLADADGLAAVSMGRVAKSLGFTTMSLYRHVRSKDELLLLMQDAVGPPPEPLDDPGDHAAGWRAGLERWAWAILAIFRRHPWMLQTVSMFGPPATPNQLTWLDRGLQCLAGTPLSEGEKLNVMLLIDAHVFSDLQFAAFPDAPPPGTAPADGYPTILSGLLDAEHFPALHRALTGGAFDDQSGPGRDEFFTFGLARILDGVESLIAARLS